MPCDTNNDPSSHISIANASFYYEEIALEWINPTAALHNGDDNNGDNNSGDYLLGPPQSSTHEETNVQFIKTIPPTKLPLHDLLFYSGRGEPTDFGYIGYEDSEFVREYDEDDYDRVRLDELKQIKIVLLANYLKKPIQKKEPGFTANSSDHVVSIEIETRNLNCSSHTLSYLKNVMSEIEKSAFCQKAKNHQKRKKVFSGLVGNHALISVFDFIDTNFLINTCSKVCPEWDKMIFYTEQSVNQIFRNRTLNFFKKNGCGDISRLNEYYNMNWLETYMMSGMFVFETYWKYIENELNVISHLKSYTNEEFFYIALKLDPLRHLKDLSEVHPLVTRLTRHQPKTILFSLNILPAVSERFYQSGFVTHYMGLKNGADEPCDAISLVERMVFAKCETPLKYNLSIDMEKGITLYNEFLKEMSLKLTSFRIPSSKSNVEVEWVAKCLCEMKEKANYFLETIMPKHRFTKFIVDDDVLIGLHLLLLDKRYSNKALVSSIVPVNTLELLQNRKRNDNELTNSIPLFPSHFQVNLFEIMLSEPDEKYKFTSTSLKPFNIPANALEFITEHVIEISEVYHQTERPLSEWIHKDIEEYLTFIRTIKNDPITPEKNIDLLFHFHMLNPNNFIQDCLRLAKFIKNHKFAFPKKY